MFDTEKFICAIELQPCLYDVANKEYSNTQLNAQSWINVYEETVENWKEITNEEKDFKGKFSLDLVKLYNFILVCFEVQT